MIEILPLQSGKLLICAGPHCVETERDDRSLDAAIKTLAEQSGEDRTRITVHVARFTLGEHA